MNAATRLVLVQQRHHKAVTSSGCSHSGRRLLTTSLKKMSAAPLSTTTTAVPSSSFSSSSLAASADRDAPPLFATRRLLSSSSAAPGYSSFNEPSPTLFLGSMLHGEQAAAVEEFDLSDDDDDNVMPVSTATPSDAQLRRDIRVMGSILGKIVKQHEGDAIFEKIEAMRLLAKKWRGGQTGVSAADVETARAAFAELATFAASLDDKELYTVTRAFTHFLAIANAAEGHHRVRRLQESQAAASAALYAKPDSCGGVLPRLLEQGIDKNDIWQALSTQTTELVLTAHPTEVNRRTILAKNRRIQEILTLADTHRRQSSSAFVMSQLDEGLHREIASIWLSDEVSRTKPTPETEAEKGTVVVDTVLWDTVPKFLRKLDATAVEFLGKPIPLTSSPIRFASWMGGDRDGNPNVKPHTTRIVCLRNRGTAATLLHDSLRKLSSELSLTSCSDELRAVVGADVREPYRRILRTMCAKLNKTRDWVDQELTSYNHYLNKNDDGGSGKMATGAISKDEIYLDQQKLMNELLMIHKSLCETGNSIAANGSLTDIIRNLAAFGLTLIPLDVRQESDKHEEAVDAITRFLGLGSYAQWDEQTKVNWLTAQITSKRPLVRRGIWNHNPDYFSETAVDTLEIFQMIADQHDGSLGAYVISQATTPSDVLAVLLLQIDAGVKKPLRVVPLFETLGDLNGAMDTMSSLFTLPAYMGLISGKQEVMIGYSVSDNDIFFIVYLELGRHKDISHILYDFIKSFSHHSGFRQGRWSSRG
jgi:phosphoenolpyruvate carboxylase